MPSLWSNIRQLHFQYLYSASYIYSVEVVKKRCGVIFVSGVDLDGVVFFYGNYCAKM